MRRAKLEHNFVKEARGAALASLTSLTLESEDPTLYFNRVTIGRGIPENHRSYGRIAESEIPGLLEPYVDNGYVLVAKIRHNTGFKEHVGYRSNLSRYEGIRREIKRGNFTAIWLL